MAASSAFGFVAAALMLSIAACSGSDPVVPEDDPGLDEGTEVVDTVAVELPVDAGESGLVIDVRNIFRKGYVATHLDISFPAHAKFNSTLDIDPVTNLALLRIHNDSLTQAERDAFADGVAADIVVYDADQTVLAQHQEVSLVLDDSGNPLGVATDNPPLTAPLTLREDVPYLLQPEDIDGVLAAGIGRLGAESMTPLASGSAVVLLSALQSLRCPDGSVAIGHDGTAGTYIHKLRLICTELASGGALGTVTTLTDTLGIKALGTLGTRKCPLDGGTQTLLVGDAGITNLHVESIGGRCLTLSDIANGATNGPAAHQAGQLGSGPTVSSDPYSLFCPTGSVVTGLRGRHVTFSVFNTGSVHEIGYICRELGGWDVQAFVPNDSSQHFHFQAVQGAAEDNTVVVRQSSRGASSYWVMQAGEVDLTSTEMDAESFVLEQDADGWVRIRVAQGTGTEYLVLDDGRIVASTTDADRFRLITDDITWNMTDQGLVYHQPASPPTQLDFAYEATIRNCSPATLTETVGRAEDRVRTVTTSTSESLQLFSSRDIGFGVKVNIGYAASAAGGVEGSVEGSFNMNWTTSDTRTTSNTTSEEITESIEVSRTRALEVPPFTAVEVYDAVRTIRDVRLPFTHVFRMTGTYEDGSALSGSEILTQLHFNLMEAVPTAVGPEHVEVGIRGQVTVDQLFETETDVNNLPGACG